MRLRSDWDEALEDIPFELVGKVASACAVAEAGDVERGAAAARHVCRLVGYRVWRCTVQTCSCDKSRVTVTGVVDDGRSQAGRKVLEAATANAWTSAPWHSHADVKYLKLRHSLDI